MIINQRECKYAAHDIHVEQIRMAICHTKTIVCMKKIKIKVSLNQVEKSPTHDRRIIYLSDRGTTATTTTLIITMIIIIITTTIIIP